MSFDFQKMLGTDILIPASSAFILLIIALTFLYLFLKGSAEDVHTYWSLMQDKVRLRLDKLPNIIETIRKYEKAQEKTIQEIIKLRNEAWPIENPSPKKVQLELSLSSNLHLLWGGLESNKELAKDVNFLAVRKEIIDLGQEIDTMADKYNVKVLHFNKRIGLFLPFAFIFGFRKLPVFEFEA